MIKIRLIIHDFLRNNIDVEKNLEIIELEYPHPITVSKLLKDAKINLEFLGLVILDGKDVNQDFLINHSCEIKLFSVLVGG